jgi:DNA polymerase (family 10)
MARSKDRTAEVLGELADLLVVSGGDPFRVRAYERTRALSSYAKAPVDLGGGMLEEIQALLAIEHIDDLEWKPYNEKSPALSHRL